jgi:hypothetical protein
MIGETRGVYFSQYTLGEKYAKGDDKYDEKEKEKGTKRKI